MDIRFPNDVLLTAAECASRTGLSTKTLRVYEAQGLITPQRTEKNWRLYGTSEIARLNEIMILKQLGLSLSRIGELLSGQPADIEGLLEIQLTTLLSRSARIESSIRLISRLQLKGRDGLSMADLLSLAKEMQMSEVRDEIAWKRYEQSRARTEVDIDPDDLQEYAGDYVFSDGLSASVRLDQKQLIMCMVGQPDFELFAEGPDKFFLKVLPAQITFGRDDSGKISELVLHQDGLELKADYASAGTFEKAKEMLQDRIESKEPHPQSAKKLRKVIDDHLNASINYDDFSPQLGSLVREQFTTVQRELERLGTLKTCDFRGVGANGFDVYVTEFENGRLEWGLSVGADERLNGLYLRPTSFD